MIVDKERLIFEDEVIDINRIQRLIIKSSGEIIVNRIIEQPLEI